MSSKANAINENERIWRQLCLWENGVTTVETHRAQIRGVQQPRTIHAETPEDRQRQARRMTLAQITFDTGAMELQLTKWKAGIHTIQTRPTPRARSRSPRRDEIKADSTSSRRAEALGYVAAHTFIRSEAETRMKAMVDERDATIAKQAKIIADLEVGKGLIGPVLKAAFDDGSTDFWRDRMERPQMKASVVQYVKENQTLGYNLSTKLMFN